MTVVWTWVSSRSLFKEHGLEFTTNYRVGEDFQLFVECLQKAARLVVLPWADYIYRSRPKFD